MGTQQILLAMSLLIERRKATGLSTPFVNSGGSHLSYMHSPNLLFHLFFPIAEWQNLGEGSGGNSCPGS